MAVAVTTIGIDLSLTATGIAWSDGRCTLAGRDGLTNLSVDAQITALNGLTAEICSLVERSRPVAVCIEGLDMSQSYGAQIERTVLWWKVVSFLRSIVIPVYVAPSAQVKMYVLGKGSGSKADMVEAVGRLWPQFRLDMVNPAYRHNLADAASCALIAAHMVGAPIGAPGTDGASYLPATHLRALQSVRSTEAPPSRGKKASRRVD